MWRRIALAAVAWTGISCAGDPTIAALSFVTTEPRVVRPEVLQSHAVGTSCYTRSFLRQLVTPPWRAMRANHAAAIDTAIAAVPDANVMTNVRVQVSVSQYLLFTRTCAIVIGNVGRVP